MKKENGKKIILEQKMIPTTFICSCIEHNNGGEVVMIVNDCPIHDEIFGNNSILTPSNEH